MLDFAMKRGIGIVICTTGFSKEDQELIEDASKKVPILRSANMSMGINLLLKLVKEAAQVLADAGFDIEIIEKHHNKKVDAPSGTALALADSINEALNNRYEYVYNRTNIRAPRVKNELGISSLRGGTIVGEHEIIYAGSDEVIEIKHTAYSKAIFAKGAIQAAKFLSDKPPGMYNMNDVIG
jgi:4-hydroxy-tetrahydrodipicolinate reductase